MNTEYLETFWGTVKHIFIKMLIVAKFFYYCKSCLCRKSKIQDHGEIPFELQLLLESSQAHLMKLSLRNYSCLINLK